jgi:CSLREA domain-containing protein
MRRWLGTSLTAGMLALCAAPAHASTITVTTHADGLAADGACSLREALLAADTDAAVSGCPAGSGADTVVLGSGTYAVEGTGPFMIGSAVTVAGRGASSTFVSGARRSEVFFIQTAAEHTPVVLRDLTVTGGAAHDGADGTNVNGGEHVTGERGDPGGGIFLNLAELTLQDAAVTGNRAGDGGDAAEGSPGDGGPGGIGGGIDNLGFLRLVRSTVSGNWAGAGGTGLSGGAGGDGGGIAGNGEITAVDSLIAGNTAGPGGAGTDASGSGGDGGGLESSATDVGIDLTSTLLTGNRAGAGGPGAAGGSGGQIHAPGTATTLSFVTARGGSAGAGTPAGAAAELALGPGSSLANTIVDAVAAGACSGAPVNGGHNLTAFAGCPGAMGDPQLGGDGAPLVHSPAVDAAASDGCPDTDVHGTARPQGVGCDIGAVEALAAAPVATPGSVDFGTFPGGGGKDASVRVHNPGVAALDIAPRVIGPDAAQFRYAGGSCQLGPLAGGWICDAELYFVSSGAPGRADATLVVGETRVPLTAFVPVPPASLPPTPLALVRAPALPARVLAGRSVNCAAGRWRDATSIAVSWLRDGVVLKGATKRAYKPTARDAGHALQCRETATRVGGTAVADSAPRAVSQRCIVPKLAGKSLGGARKALTRAGCRLGTVTRRGGGRRGRIRSTRPRAGSSLPLHARVRVVLPRR